MHIPNVVSDSNGKQYHAWRATARFNPPSDISNPRYLEEDGVSQMVWHAYGRYANGELSRIIVAESSSKLKLQHMGCH